MPYKQPTFECDLCGKKFRPGGDKQNRRVLAHTQAHERAYIAVSRAGGTQAEMDAAYRAPADV